ncbi:hypothetical protein CFP56_003912 [Quercus suber]|uniref:Uncharacterized protein n=1 Tax=Quercus suber TaxID=58331 RepID=A0AAW0LBW2_QUESU
MAIVERSIPQLGGFEIGWKFQHEGDIAWPIFGRMLLQIKKPSCGRLSITSSTAKSMVQLKKMSVSECERIVEERGGEASEVITFAQLTFLKLDCLPKLTSFCLGSHSFEFPSLEEVKAFYHGPLWTPELERVQSTKEDEWHWKTALNTNTLALKGQIIIPTHNSFVEKG